MYKCDAHPVQIYEKFIPHYLTLHTMARPAASAVDGAGAGMGRRAGSSEEEGFEMMQLNHRRCVSCGSSWLARYDPVPATSLS